MSKSIPSQPNRQFKISDLLGPWSPLTLRQIQSSYDIKVDVQQLAERGLTKQQLFALSYVEVILSEKHFKYPVLDNADIAEIVDEIERIRKNRMAFLIKSSFLRGLDEEALALYVKIRQSIEAEKEFLRYIRGRADENYRRMVAATEAEMEKYDEEMRKLISMELERIRDEAQKKWEDIQEEIRKTNGRLEKLLTIRDQLIKEHAIEFKSAIDRFFVSSPAAEIYQEISEEKKKQYAEELLKAIHINKEEIKYLQDENEEGLRKIAQYEQRVSDIRIATMRQVTPSETTRYSTPQTIVSSNNLIRSPIISFQRPLESQANNVLSNNPEVHLVEQEIAKIRITNTERDLQISTLVEEGPQIREQVAKKVFGSKLTERLNEKMPGFTSELERNTDVSRVLGNVDVALREVGNDVRSENKLLRSLEKVRDNIPGDYVRVIDRFSADTDVPPPPPPSFVLGALKRNKPPTN